MLRKSPIKLKKGLCVDCPEGSSDKVLVAGRCSYHYKRHRHKENEAKRRGTSVKQPDQKPWNVPKKSKSKIPGLDIWFDYWIRNCGNRCEETGEPIVPEWAEPTKNHMDSLYAAQAHILPKTHFKSVASVIENHMTLSARNGSHSRFDKSWESAMRMRVWSVVVERFRKFCHLIAPEELRRLPDVLRAIYEEEITRRVT
jgi:hypothetical protein